MERFRRYCRCDLGWLLSGRVTYGLFDVDEVLVDLEAAHPRRVARLPPVQHYSQATDFAQAGMVPAFSGKGSWRVSEVVLGIPLS